MKFGAPGAVLLVSIDGSADESVRPLAALLEKHAIAAVWKLARPAMAAESPWLLGARVRHEIALSLEDTWSGACVSRSGFSKELAWRLDSAKASGIDVTTAGSKAPIPSLRHETLARHGVSMLCDDISPANKPVKMSLLRYGLWRAPVSIGLPRPQKMFGAGAASICQKVIDLSVKGKELAHLAIDAVAASDARELAVIDRALAHAAGLRHAGALSIATPRVYLEACKRPATHGVARSIMRAA